MIELMKKIALSMIFYIKNDILKNVRMYSNYNISDRRLVQYEQLSITYQIRQGKNFAIIDILRFLIYFTLWC